MGGGIVLVGYLYYLVVFVVPYVTMLLVWGLIGRAFARRIGDSITLTDAVSTLARSAFLAVAVLILVIGFFSNKFSPGDVLFRTVPVFAALLGCIVRAQNPPIMRRVATGVLLVAAMLPQLIFADEIQTPPPDRTWSAMFASLLIAILSGPLIAIGLTAVLLNPRHWPVSAALVTFGLVILPIVLTVFAG